MFKVSFCHIRAKETHFRSLFVTYARKRWPAQWVQTIVYFDAFTLSYGHAVAGVKHNDWRILIFDIFDVHGIAGSLDDGTTGAFRLCVIVEEACGVVARTTENDDIVVFRDGETVGT